jgi:hypothetical protein
MSRFQPTLHKPGSELKIEVMAKRRRKKLPLFHPLDYAEPRTNTITLMPTGTDRAAMRIKLSSDPKRHKPGARVGYFREPT